MTCPRCGGLAVEHVELVEEGLIDDVACVNCGWHSRGTVVERSYGALRPVLPKGYPEVAGRGRKVGT